MCGALPVELAIANDKALRVLIGEAETVRGLAHLTQRAQARLVRDACPPELLGNFLGRDFLQKVHTSSHVVMKNGTQCKEKACMEETSIVSVSGWCACCVSARSCKFLHALSTSSSSLLVQSTVSPEAQHMCMGSSSVACFMLNSSHLPWSSSRFLKLIENRLPALQAPGLTTATKSVG